MRRGVAWCATTAAALAAAGTVAVAAGPAGAATPPWESGDANDVATLAFYDASGAVITHGSTSTAPFAAFVAASKDIRSGDTSADLEFVTPGTTPGTFYAQELTGYAKYATGAPSSIGAVPVVAGASGDATLDTLVGNSKPNPNSGYSNVYQIRMYTANAAGQQGSGYAAADIQINASAHTWTEVYPSGSTVTPPPKAADATTLSASKNVTVAKGKSVKLTTKLTDRRTHKGFAGKVQLLRAPAKGGKFKVVKTVSAARSGAASATVKATASARYEWHFAGTKTHKAATSRVSRITVKAKH